MPTLQVNFLENAVFTFRTWLRIGYDSTLLLLFVVTRADRPRRSDPPRSSQYLAGTSSPLREPAWT